VQLTASTGATKLFVSNMWCEGELLAAAAAAYIILSKKKKQRRRRKFRSDQVFKKEMNMVCYVS
jgi:hypothetical protein